VSRNFVAAFFFTRARNALGSCSWSNAVGIGSSSAMRAPPSLVSFSPVVERMSTGAGWSTSEMLARSSQDISLTSLASPVTKTLHTFLTPDHSLGRAPSFAFSRGYHAQIEVFSRAARRCGLHADRAARGDSDHRHPDRPASARRPESA